MNAEYELQVDMDRQDQLNVFDEPVESCSERPLTGFYRNGNCETGVEDAGSHTVCIQVTDEFLHFSKASGNDLSTPLPNFGFPGLKAGDRWCLCAARFVEAHKAGKAPRVILTATHKRALELIPLEELKPYALDLS